MHASKVLLNLSDYPYLNLIPLLLLLIIILGSIEAFKGDLSCIQIAVLFGVSHFS